MIHDNILPQQPVENQSVFCFVVQLRAIVVLNLGGINKVIYEYIKKANTKLILDSPGNCM